jgi:hypothetical protein
MFCKDNITFATSCDARTTFRGFFVDHANSTPTIPVKKCQDNCSDCNTATAGTTDDPEGTDCLACHVPFVLTEKANGNGQFECSCPTGFGFFEGTLVANDPVTCRQCSIHHCQDCTGGIDTCTTCFEGYKLFRASDGTLSCERIMKPNDYLLPAKYIHTHFEITQDCRADCESCTLVDKLTTPLYQCTSCAPGRRLYKNINEVFCVCPPG